MEMIQAINSLEPWDLPAMHCAIYGQVTQIISRPHAPHTVFFVEYRPGMSCRVRCPANLANGLGEGVLVEILATTYQNPQGISYDATHLRKLSSYNDERGPLLRLINLFKRFGELTSDKLDNK